MSWGGASAAEAAADDMAAAGVLARSVTFQNARLSSICVGLSKHARTSVNIGCQFYSRLVGRN